MIRIVVKALFKYANGQATGLQVILCHRFVIECHGKIVNFFQTFRGMIFSFYSVAIRVLLIISIISRAASGMLVPGPKMAETPLAFKKS